MTMNMDDDELHMRIHQAPLPAFSQQTLHKFPANATGTAGDESGATAQVLCTC